MITQPNNLPAQIRLSRGQPFLAVGDAAATLGRSETFRYPRQGHKELSGPDIGERKLHLDRPRGFLKLTKPGTEPLGRGLSGQALPLGSGPREELFYLAEPCPYFRFVHVTGSGVSKP